MVPFPFTSDEITCFQAQFADRVAEELSELNFLFLSDVWLDHPQTLPGLQKMFDHCMENSYIPKVIVLCGNFTSRSLAHGNSREIQRYQGRGFSILLIPSSPLTTDDLDSLAELISSYPLITRSTHFVFVPGPLDITANAILPRRPLLPSFTTRLRAKIPQVHFASNPCRIKFFHQEIVVFREDCMAKMLRNIVGVKPEVKSEDLKRFVRPRCSLIWPTMKSASFSLFRLYWTKVI